MASSTLSKNVQRSMMASVVSLASVASILGATSSQAAIINGGFETGNFTGWSTIGNTNVEPSARVGSTTGNFIAIASTFGTASNGLTVTDSNLEAFLGVPNGSLDSLGNGNVSSGSAIKQTIEAEVGDVLTFNWNFLTFETANRPDYPFNDFAFVSIKGLKELADAFSPLVASTIPSFTLESGFKQFSYTFEQAGTYELGFGVVDVENVPENVEYPSALLVDEVKLSESAASVPEPASIVGLLTLGAMGVGSMLKRKQHHQA